MLNTKNLIITIENVPSYWVFQYYLNLDEELTGQDVKIKSIFNPSERTPSMCLYVDNALNPDGSKSNQYVYKDFSTGKFGNKINLVMHLLNISFPNAVDKIIDDYNKSDAKGSNNKTFKVQNRWKVDFVKERSWNQQDARFWLQFNIGATLLDKYNVRPLEYYNLVLENDSSVETQKITNNNIYGYFTKDGDVFKIYRPFSRKHKFFKVRSYLQGLDQLEYKNPYLVICSSLKDAMCLKSMGYNVDVISPDSENTVIKPYIIENLKLKYQKVITLFDNDTAGATAIEKYHQLYGINGFALPLSKDISDAMKEHGFDKVHSELKPLLKKAIYGK